MGQGKKEEVENEEEANGKKGHRTDRCSARKRETQ
jgi:hypothetical protein